MNELTLHPNVYATGHNKGLIGLLERVWVREHRPGDGTFYIVSGFANYNGGLRFYETFREHVQQGGKVLSIFSGSTNARLTSKQVVSEMLDCGAEVYVVSRKRLLHAKCYGTLSSQGDRVIVTSGNFTGPGMSQNVELSVLLTPPSTQAMNFSWDAMMTSLLAQRWDFYQPSLADRTAPVWQLLYDEHEAELVLDESQEVTLLLRLSHSDTARINAAPGTKAAKGTQYFWLSKDCFDFFPPLTIRNKRGAKAAYSCEINLDYVDLGVVEPDCRVDYQAENNLDFRLGTGKLRHQGLVQEGDLAAITRRGETEYDLRLFRQDSPEYALLNPYMTRLIGHKGKKYGFISNSDFSRLLNIRLNR
jgi:hypothetical protein